MVGGQLMAWGKLKTTDNTMYPKAFQDLSGWNVRSMACGASTYAVAASAGSEESTITWCALLHTGPAPQPRMHRMLRLPHHPQSAGQW